MGVEIDWGGFNNAYQRTADTFSAIPGQVVQGFQQGQRRNALSQYAMHPDDPNSINALAKVDPETAIQARQHQSQAQAAKHDRDTKIIAGLARDAKDPASFDAAVDQVVQLGYPEAAQFKGKFSPALRSALMNAGGISDAADHQPAVVQGYEYRQSLPEAERGQFDKYQQNARPQIFGSAEAGYNVFDPNGQQPAAAELPHVADQAGYDALPPGAQYTAPDGKVRVKAGGQTQPASGNFP